MNAQLRLTTDITCTLTARNAVPFNMRLVRKGEKYGKDRALTHDREMPLIEFYDARYAFDALGQFVSRYNADDYLAAPEGGIDLEGGIDAWTIDAHTNSLFREVARRWVISM